MLKTKNFSNFLNCAIEDFMVTRSHKTFFTFRLHNSTNFKQLGQAQFLRYFQTFFEDRIYRSAFSHFEFMNIVTCFFLQQKKIVHFKGHFKSPSTKMALTCLKQKFFQILIIIFPNAHPVIFTTTIADFIVIRRSQKFFQSMK